jgi:TPR repeat protein
MIMNNTLKARLAALTMAITLLVTSGGVSFAQDFEKGLETAEKGDYAPALREWGILAEQGNAKAQFNLGVMYAKGLGVSQDYKEAAKWFRKSAEQGHENAQYNLGLIYGLAPQQQ